MPPVRTRCWPGFPCVSRRMRALIRAFTGGGAQRAHPVIVFRGPSQFGHNQNVAGGLQVRSRSLSQNVHRDYETATGRFLQSDPIGLRGGPSTYAYVSGDPLDLIDPLGLEGIGVWTFAPGPQRDEYLALRSLCPKFNFSDFANYIEQNAVDPEKVAATLGATFGIGSMPKTPTELRGLGLSVDEMNPWTSQLSRWSGRLGTRTLRKLGRTGAGKLASGVATGATIFEGFYDLSIEFQAIYAGTTWQKCDCQQ